MNIQVLNIVVKRTGPEALLREALSSSIVLINRRRLCLRVTQVGKELAVNKDQMAGLVQSDGFSVAGGVRKLRLLTRLTENNGTVEHDDDAGLATLLVCLGEAGVHKHYKSVRRVNFAIRAGPRAARKAQGCLAGVVDVAACSIEGIKVRSCGAVAMEASLEQMNRRSG
jgi:hypothetical protein